jgi:hypothetical protein
LVADSPFYNDLKPPFITADVTAVTLATTAKALHTVAQVPALGGAGYWWLGKKLRMRAFGRITTVTTPGNLTLQLLYGTGADANGVVLAASAAVALVVSQTNMSWMAQFWIHCRALGASGALFADGIAHFNPAVIASTNQPIMIPASAPVQSAAVDLTNAGLGFSLQALRSGSTAETMQVHDVDLEAMN